MPQSLHEILATIQQIARDNKLSEPFICGGVPRDKLLGRVQTIEDVDITTGDETVHQLAWLISKVFKNSSYQRLSDGHAQVHLEPFKLDFSSNYRAPGIEALLEKAGVKNPNGMLMELLSRDFTCNALLLTMDLKNIKDPTGLGLNDIKLKRIRTCLPAYMTLGNDNKRVVRVLYLAAKLGFEVDDEINEWIKKNPAAIANVKPRYLSDKLQQAVDYDKERTVKLLDEMGLWSRVPLLPDLMPYASQPQRILTAKKRKPVEVCPTCEGEGVDLESYRGFSPEDDDYIGHERILDWELCPTCGGAGEIDPEAEKFEEGFRILSPDEPDWVEEEENEIVESDEPFIDYYSRHPPHQKVLGYAKIFCKLAEVKQFRSVEEAAKFLGVNVNDDPETIKAAYKARVRQSHPDINPGAEDDMKSLNLAYEMLSSSSSGRGFDWASGWESGDMPAWQEAGFQNEGQYNEWAEHEAAANTAMEDEFNAWEARTAGMSCDELLNEYLQNFNPLIEQEIEDKTGLKNDFEFLKNIIKAKVTDDNYQQMERAFYHIFELAYNKKLTSEQVASLPDYWKRRLREELMRRHEAEQEAAEEEGFTSAEEMKAYDRRQEELEQEQHKKMAGIMTDLVSKQLAGKQPAARKTAYTHKITLPHGVTAIIPEKPFGTNGEVNVMFQFRWTAKKGTPFESAPPSQAGVNTVIVYVDAKGIDRGALAQKYGSPEFINGSIQSILSQLKQYRPDVKLGKLGLSGFSGGYGPIRTALTNRSKLIKDPDAVILADAIYDVPGETMKPWAQYAADAAKDPNKKFVYLHTQYPKTKAAGEFLAAQVGATKTKAEPRPNWNITPTSQATHGGVSIFETDKSHGTTGYALPHMWNTFLSDWG